MKRPKDILSQPYHIQEYINYLERKKLNIDGVSKCQHSYKKVISGDDGMWCTECNKYITTF
jgi:hypothetical protein